jgi:methylated-DNA-[protein]-cysteine S-methyltransferase
MADAAHTYLVFETAGGFCGIAWNGIGVTRFQLPTGSAAETERLLLRRLPEARRGEPGAGIADVVSAVRRYFSGKPTDFSGVPLDIGRQEPFFRDVYAAARRLGWGQTTTYGRLAKDLGAGPEAAREVGQAMAKNPVALIIPCHRVLAAGGKIGGFSAPGGAISKLKMLELEGVPMGSPEPVQQAFGF